MAKKNLSKTIIEGGRTKESKSDRRGSLRTARTTARCKLHSCSDYEELQFQKRIQFSDTWIDEKFDDKLGPLKRWLARQVGRPWDGIYSEIKKKFDTRTTPGRHVVYDHLFQYVDVKGLESRKYADYYVDGSGILRENKNSWRQSIRKYNALHREREQAFKWLARRKIIQRGQYYYWSEPVKPFDGFVSFNHNTGQYFYAERTIYSWITRKSLIQFRQTRVLNKEELKYFTSLSPDTQKIILKLSTT